MPITERELRKAYPQHRDRIAFASAGAKTPQAIRRELQALFDAGLSYAEAQPMVVPIGHNMQAAFRAEWMDWEAARRDRNTAA
jgi:hypothetical protein